MVLQLHANDLPRKDKVRPRLGELLEEAGIIKPDQLAEAMAASKTTGLSVGRSLVRLGHANDVVVNSALAAQNMIKQGLLNREQAIEALQVSAERHIPIEKALKFVDKAEAPLERTGEIASLLMAAGLINKPLFEESVAQSKARQMLIGRYLLMQGTITSEMLGAVLEAIVHTRDGHITRDQSISALTQVFLRRVSLEVALKDLGYYLVPNKHRIKIGELLTAADLITESDWLNAVETGLQNLQMTGDVLIQNGLVTKEIVDAALRLQEMVGDGAVNRHLAIELLRQVAQSGAPLEQVASHLKVFENKVEVDKKTAELLLKAGVINNIEAPTEQVPPGAVTQPMDRARITGRWKKPQHSLKAVDKEIVETARQVHNEMEAGSLTEHQAIETLRALKEQRQTGGHLTQVQTEECQLGALSLLAQAGILSAQNLSAGTKAAKHDDVPVADYLIKTAVLSQEIFQAALEGVNLMKTSGYKAEQMIIALHVCERSRVTMHQAVQDLGFTPEPITMTVQKLVMETKPERVKQKLLVQLAILVAITAVFGAVILFFIPPQWAGYGWIALGVLLSIVMLDFFYVRQSHDERMELRLDAARMKRK